MGSFAFNLGHNLLQTAYTKDMQKGIFLSISLLSVSLQDHSFPVIKAYFFRSLAYTEDQLKTSSLLDLTTNIFLDFLLIDS